MENSQHLETSKNSPKHMVNNSLEWGQSKIVLTVQDLSLNSSLHTVAPPLKFDPMLPVISLTASTGDFISMFAH
jgi:hypothetical protein